MISFMPYETSIANAPLPYAQSTTIKSIRALAPLLDRVLVQRIKAETKTAGGIFLPESAQKELNEAKVLAVGPGAMDKEGKRITMGVQAGDRVLIPQVCWEARCMGENREERRIYWLENGDCLPRMGNED